MTKAMHPRSEGPEQVIVVEGLKVKELGYHGSVFHYAEIGALPELPPSVDPGIKPGEVEIISKSVPIHQVFTDYGRKNYRVVVTEEIEKLLGVPFNLMVETNRSLEACCERLRTEKGACEEKLFALYRLKWWQRLLAVFVGLETKELKNAGT